MSKFGSTTNSKCCTVLLMWTGQVNNMMFPPLHCEYFRLNGSAISWKSNVNQQGPHLLLKVECIKLNN